MRDINPQRELTQWSLSKEYTWEAIMSYIWSNIRSGSNSENWTWNNRLVPNRKRSTSRLYIVTLLI